MTRNASLWHQGLEQNHIAGIAVGKEEKVFDVWVLVLSLAVRLCHLGSQCNHLEFISSIHQPPCSDVSAPWESLARWLEIVETA